jgi:hypothetical protein
MPAAIIASPGMRSPCLPSFATSLDQRSFSSLNPSVSF